MIHEKQVRQLCAIHTVNNLLQLDGKYDEISKSDDGGHGRDEQEEEGCSATDECQQKMPTSIPMVHEWTCYGRLLRRDEKTTRYDVSNSDDMSQPSESNEGMEAKKHLKRPWRVATQKEFDDIAKELTLREQMLMEGDESTFLSTTSSKEEAKSSGMTKERLNKLSMMQRIRSQYGSPYMGNYSFEVIEEALQRRGVELEFYRVPNDTNTPINDHNAGKEGDNSGDASSRSSKCLIGFVIYQKEENQRNTLSMLARMGSYIPLVKYFCGVGQHWYAITGVSYNQHRSQNIHSEIESNAKKDINYASWSLVDSKLDDIHSFHTDEDLMNYLREIEQGGGLVFRASADCEQSSNGVQTSGN